MFLCDLISPLLPLEQFDLNAELQLSQSRSSCGQPIRSRPFCFFMEKKRNLPSSLTELCRELAGLLASHGTSSNGQREGGKEQGRLRSDRQSWDQGPGGGQHSHSLHADDSLERISAGENLTSCYAQTQAALCDYAARNTAAFTSRTVNSVHIQFGVWYEQINSNVESCATSALLSSLRLTLK